MDIKHGETGTAIPQSSMTYIKRTVSSQDFFFPAANTVYRNDDGTGGQTTSTQLHLARLDRPDRVGHDNAADCDDGPERPELRDHRPRPSSTPSAGRSGRRIRPGSSSYTQYDTVTGAVVKTIADVNTANTGDFANLPSGWSTPSGGGLHLITTYEVDALGRVTKTTSPEGRIDYTVYNDANHEVRTLLRLEHHDQHPDRADVGLAVRHRGRLHRIADHVRDAERCRAAGRRGPRASPTCSRCRAATPTRPGR